MSKEEWYTAKGIFLHDSKYENAKPKYEERVVLLKATSEKDALKQAKKDAKACVKGLDGVHLIQIVDVWRPYDQGKLKPGAELFVSMVVSEMEPDEYIKTFYADAPEDCETLGDKHSWHNLDGKRSACYNCLTIRKGKLWKTENE
jgi:hypothetical protein